MDRPILGLAKAVRARIRPGLLRDVLHGVPTGKPLHPPLAGVTLGCWMSAALLDLAKADPRAVRVLVATGIMTSLPTAAAGLTDWSSLHREQQRVGFVHMLSNVAALGLFSASLVARVRGRERTGRTLSYAGLTAVGLGGYLGGHLAYRLAAGANHAPPVVPPGAAGLARPVPVQGPAGGPGGLAAAGLPPAVRAAAQRGRDRARRPVPAPVAGRSTRAGWSWRTASRA